MDYETWLRPLARGQRADARRCRVCGHLTLSPVRQSVNKLLLVFLGAALCYIVVDVAMDGRFDGNVFRAITDYWTSQAPSRDGR
jgi:hypothetical protein